MVKKDKHVAFRIDESFPLTGKDVKYLLVNVVNMFVALKENRLQKYFDENPKMMETMNVLHGVDNE